MSGAMPSRSVGMSLGVIAFTMLPGSEHCKPEWQVVDLPYFVGAISGGAHGATYVAVGLYATDHGSPSIRQVFASRITRR